MGEDFFRAFFSALSNELPFMATLIIGSLMWAFGSTGIFFGGGKIDNRVRKPLRVIGITLTFFGFITTVITVMLFFWGFLQPYLTSIVNLGTGIIRFFSSPVILLILGTAGLLLVYINRLRIKQIESGYKLRAITVLDGIVGSQVARIQVENIGNGKFYCIARLIKITASPGNRNNIETDIYKINPKGLFLRWDDGRGVALLQENVPRSIGLAYARSGYDSQVIFLFSDNEHSNHIVAGKYSIEIGLFRVEGSRHIEISTVEDVLEVRSGGRSNYELKWLGRQNN